MNNLTIKPGGKLTGRISIPGDKSISHRALMLCAIAQGSSEIHHFLAGEDNLATLQALRALGADITQKTSTHLEIQGVGKHGLKGSSHALDLGNAGTGFRLLAGLLAGQAFSSTLVGDASLSKRPMDRIMTPLQKMGAKMTAHEDRFAPLHIHGTSQLNAIDYTLPIPSAQVKSCLLLAGLYAHDKTAITEPITTRDHTERLLQYLDYPCDITLSDESKKIYLTSDGELQGKKITIPGDFSSAAFFIVGALIAPQSELIIENVGLNPTRTGLLTLLKMMGGDIEILDQSMLDNEPIGTLRIRASELHGITVPPALIPSCIDELPIFFIACACARGETYVSEIAELRVKESDRLITMSTALATLGIAHEITADSIHIQGGQLTGGLIDSHHDHRIAMALSIAGLRSRTPIYLKNCDKVGTSFPNFASLAHGIGLKIHAVYS